MVAYSFQKRFCDDVAGFVKHQTIRANRKRHAYVGEPVQLYYGMRSKHCRKLIHPDPVCTAVIPIRIGVPEGTGVALVSLDGALFDYVSDAFARADGFDDVHDFTRFWFDTHGPVNFSGVLIRWHRA